MTKMYDFLESLDYDAY